MLESSTLTASDIMTHEVITVAPHTSLIYAAKLLAKNHISGVPVVDDNGKIVGIVSEADLVRWHDHDGEKQAWWLDMLGEGFNLEPGFLDFVRSEQGKVRVVMKTDVVAIGPSMPVNDIARVLTEKSIKRVPVTENGKLLGIVSRSDLVGVLARG
jgi:CBS domain-containing protein